VAAGGSHHRVRARDTRVVVEAQAQHDRSARALGGAEAARDPVDKGRECGFDLFRRVMRAAERALRADRPSAAAHLHRPPDLDCAPSACK